MHKHIPDVHCTIFMTMTRSNRRKITGLAFPLLCFLPADFFHFLERGSNEQLSRPISDLSVETAKRVIYECHGMQATKLPSAPVHHRHQILSKLLMFLQDRQRPLAISKSHLNDLPLL